LRLRVHCNPGFEEASTKELLSLGLGVTGRGSGYVTAEAARESIYLLNRYGRTFDRVLFRVGFCGLYEGDVVSSILSSSDFRVLGRPSTMSLDADDFIARLRSRWVTGTHAALPAALGGRHGRVRLVRRDADASFFLTVEGEEVSLYVDTSGEPLNFREYRIYNHPSSIKPTLAASLVVMAECKGGAFLDPFCGGGTILIEAAMMAAARPTHSRRSYRFRNFAGHDAKAEAAAVPATSVIPPFASLSGVDINAVHLKGCRRNISAAGVQNVTVALADCTKSVASPRADVIVTNPPYGVRGSKLNRMGLLYDRFVANLPNLMKEGGTAVLVTSDFEEFRRILRGKGIPLIEGTRTLHSHLWVEAMKFRLPVR
jgi:putative N6-adenine-specific DNA methylase